MAKISEILTYLGLGPVGGYAYGQHRKHRSRENRRLKKSEKEIRKYLKKHGTEKFMKFPNLTGSQNSLLKELVQGSRPGQQTTLERNPLYQRGSAQINDLLSDEPRAYQAYREPILRDYREKVLPEIMSKFGGVGPEQSSALQNELSRSGTDLGARLGALRAELQGQGIGQAYNYATANEDTRLQQQNLGLGTRAFNSLYRPATPPNPYQQQPSFLQSFANAAGPGIGAGIGAAAGGPVGGAIGGGIGRGFGNAFQPRPAAAVPAYGRAAPLV